MKFYSPTDFLKLPTANFVLENTGSHGSIGSPVPGMIVWDTGSAPPTFWIYTGTGWASYLLSTTPLNNITPPSGDVNMNFHLIHNLEPGVADGDAVNVSQLTSVAAGIDAKASVRARVTTAPGSWDGTRWSSVPLFLDGLTPAVGERFLVDLGTATSGIFTWAAGDLLIRATDMDTWSEVPGAFTFVEEGTSADRGYVSTANRGGTLNTTAIPWAQFSAATAYTAGAGLSLVGTDLSVNVDGATIEIVTDTLRVKDGGITSAKIADGTIAAVDLADGAVTSVKIADGTIVAGDLAPGTIPASLPPSGPAGGGLTGTYPNPTLATDSVGAGQIITGAVGSDEIADGQVTTTELANGAVTLGKMAANSVDSSKVVDGSITASDLAPGTIPAALPPSGPAGGDLTGTYPNPQIGTGVIVDSDVAAANKDGLAATPSMRTLGTGAQQAAAGNHTHAGAGTVSKASVASPALTANTWSASILHSLGNAHPMIRVEDAATGEQVGIDTKPIDANNVAVRAGMAVAASAFLVVVQG